MTKRKMTEDDLRSFIEVANGNAGAEIFSFYEEACRYTVFACDHGITTGTLQEVCRTMQTVAVLTARYDLRRKEARL